MSDVVSWCRWTSRCLIPTTPVSFRRQVQEISGEPSRCGRLLVLVDKPWDGVTFYLKIIHILNRQSRRSQGYWSSWLKTIITGRKIPSTVLTLGPQMTTLRRSVDLRGTRNYKLKFPTLREYESPAKSREGEGGGRGDYRGPQRLSVKRIRIERDYSVLNLSYTIPRTNKESHCNGKKTQRSFMTKLPFHTKEPRQSPNEEVTVWVT